MNENNTTTTYNIIANNINNNNTIIAKTKPNRIKELREAAGLTQFELAEILHVCQGTLSNWERGIHDLMNDTLIQLADFFDCSIDYILGVKEQKFTPESEAKNTTAILNGISYAYSGGNSADLTNKDVDDIINILKIARGLREKRE